MRKYTILIYNHADLQKPHGCSRCQRFYGIADVQPLKYVLSVSVNGVYTDAQYVGNMFA